MSGFEQRWDVVLVQTSVAEYQHAALDHFRDRMSGRLTIMTGRVHFDPTIQCRYEGSGTVIVQNWFALGRRFLWQRGVVGACLRAQIVILELNPHILSTWLVLLGRRLLGRRSAVWGHAWPRRGVHARTDVVRNWMRRLADVVLVYTEQEAAELRQRMRGANVVAAPNALYHRAQIGAADDGAAATNFVYVGRLVRSKAPDLLVKAFLRALPSLPSDVQLVIVGDGPLRGELQELSAGADGRVVFVGAVWQEDELRAMYASAIASVSPGYAGLSVIQSHAFGVPIIFARGLAHAPEIGAAIEGRNAIGFIAGSIEDLTSCLVRVASDRVMWAGRRAEISRACAREYSLEGMIDRVVGAVEELYPAATHGVAA